MAAVINDHFEQLKVQFFLSNNLHILQILRATKCNWNRNIEYKLTKIYKIKLKNPSTEPSMLLKYKDMFTGSRPFFEEILQTECCEYCIIFLDITS